MHTCEYIARAQSRGKLAVSAARRVSCARLGAHHNTVAVVKRSGYNFGFFFSYCKIVANTCTKSELNENETVLFRWSWLIYNML